MYIIIILNLLLFLYNIFKNRKNNIYNNKLTWIIYYKQYILKEKVKKTKIMIKSLILQITIIIKNKPIIQIILYLIIPFPKK